jgi:hypothetical protein
MGTYRPYDNTLEKPPKSHETVSLGLQYSNMATKMHTYEIWGYF